MDRFNRCGKLDEFAARKIKWKGDDSAEDNMVLSVTGYDDGYIELYDSTENKYYVFDYADFIKAVTAERMRHD